MNKEHDIQALTYSPLGAWAIIEVKGISINLYHDCYKYKSARIKVIRSDTAYKAAIPDWGIGCLGPAVAGGGGGWAIGRAYRTARYFQDWVVSRRTSRKNRYKCSFCNAYAPLRLAAAYKLLIRV